MAPTSSPSRPASGPASSASGAPTPPVSAPPPHRSSSEPPTPFAFPARVRGRAPDRGARRLTIVASVLVHGLAAVGAIAYSFWHIEEVAPARGTVTFVSAAALPPPPPPPP